MLELKYISDSRRIRRIDKLYKYLKKDIRLIANVL